MKLKFVEVEGFRGFRQRARFEFPKGFMVVFRKEWGREGRSRDAVDYVITGTINKYAVSNARGGGLPDHIWWVGEGHPEQYYVSVGFMSDQGEEFTVTRRRDKPEAEGLSDVMQLSSSGAQRRRRWHWGRRGNAYDIDQRRIDLGSELRPPRTSKVQRCSIGDWWHCWTGSHSTDDQHS